MKAGARRHARTEEDFEQLLAVNRRQLERLVDTELLRLRVVELEHALDDMTAARDSMKVERDQIHRQHYELLARLRRVGEGV